MVYLFRVMAMVKERLYMVLMDASLVFFVRWVPIINPALQLKLEQRIAGKAGTGGESIYGAWKRMAQMELKLI